MREFILLGKLLFSYLFLHGGIKVIPATLQTVSLPAMCVTVPIAEILKSKKVAPYKLNMGNSTSPQYLSYSDKGINTPTDKILPEYHLSFVPTAGK